MVVGSVLHGADVLTVVGRSDVGDAKVDVPVGEPVPHQFGPPLVVEELLAVLVLAGPVVMDGLGKLVADPPDLQGSSIVFGGQSTREDDVAPHGGREGAARPHHPERGCKDTSLYLH